MWIFCMRSASELLAQLGLPELSGRCARDRVEELEALRQLPLRELVGEMRAQVFRCRGLAWTKHDAGERAFAPLRIGHGDHCRFRNRRVRSEERRVGTECRCRW